MVVKEKVGRRRYIICKKADNIRNVISQFRGKVVYENGEYVILFCKHTYKDLALKVLRENGIQTYKTVGSIKKAKKIMSEISTGL